MTPVRYLYRKDGMDYACVDHAEDTGSKGMTGHDGSDESTPYERMNRYGDWK